MTDKKHDLRMRHERGEVLFDRQPRGALLLQIGVQRSGADLEWNFATIPRRHVKRLMELLKKGGK